MLSELQAFTLAKPDKVVGLENGKLVEFTSRYGWPTSEWGVAFQVMGAVLVFTAFIPVVIQILRSKRTESLSVMMWIVTVIGLGLLGIFAWMGVSVNVGGFILVALAQTLSCVLSTIVLIFKLINRSRAKKAGMSELEYNNLHYPVKVK